MRTVLSIVAVIALSLASPGWASQCPSLMAKVQAGLEQYKKKPGLAIKDARIAAVETNLRAAQSAHENGQHAEAEHQANEALKLLAQ